MQLGRLLLGPFGQLVAANARRRQRKQQDAPQLRIPVIAVGNVLLGGAGKTPACLGLLQALQAKGLRAGLISRGYGLRPELKSSDQPRVLLPGASANPDWIGDEPWLIHHRAGVPVAIHPDRHQAGRALLSHCPDLEVVVLDDGLSQTSLRPQIRVLLLDDRLLGNGLCLPAGPNRFAWPPLHFAQPDLVLIKGTPNAESLSVLLSSLHPRPPVAGLSMRPSQWVGLQEHQSLSSLRAQIQGHPSPTVWAVAGIAEPHRFFDDLRAQGLPLTQCIALDDHAFNPWGTLERIRGSQDWPDFILTTEKDFGKFQSSHSTRADFPWARLWALQLDHSLPPEWTQHLIARLQCRDGLQSA